MSALPDNGQRMDGIQRRLSAVARVLLARRIARAVPAMLTGASLGVVAGLLLLVLLPRMLFAWALADPVAVTAMAGAVGALAGAIGALRGVRNIGIRDAALALEARLASRDGSLSTALEAEGAFSAPLLRSAETELAAALNAPAPHMLTTRSLLATPGVLIVAALVVALCWDTPLAAPDTLTGQVHPVTRNQGGPGAVDATTSRSEADQAAVNEAMGLKKIAGRMEQAATTLRNAGNEVDAQTALDNARAAMGELPPGAGTALALPQSAPTTAEARAKLADDILQTAGSLNKQAETRLGNRTGGEGSGAGTTDANPQARFVAFPKLAWQAGPEAGASELAGQSPARRALVERAMK